MDVLNVTGYQRRTPHVVAECKGFFAKEQLELNFHRTTFAPDHNRGMHPICKMPTALRSRCSR